MFSKININAIIRDHHRTLFNENTSTPSLGDFILFYFVPAAFAVFMVSLNYCMSENMINIIIASLSIFVGLLLNLLAILMGFLDKYRDQITEIKSKFVEGGDNLQFEREIDFKSKKQKLLHQTYFNISFAVLTAIVSIPVMIMGLSKNQLLIVASNIVGYAFLSMFTLTLLMILKRVHVILSNND